jgi:hypothetical protein
MGPPAVPSVMKVVEDVISKLSDQGTLFLSDFVDVPLAIPYEKLDF